MDAVWFGMPVDTEMSTVSKNKHVSVITRVPAVNLLYVSHILAFKIADFSAGFVS